MKRFGLWVPMRQLQTWVYQKIILQLIWRSWLLQIDFIGEAFCIIILLRNGISIKGIGFHNVRPSVAIGFMDLPHYIRTGKAE